MASDAVRAAMARRQQRADERSARIEWFIQNVSDKIAHTMHQRVTIATHYVKDKVVRNISRPVTKKKGGGGRDQSGRFLKTSTKVTDRSKPGEFPKADTTQLMKTIFDEVQRDGKSSTGYIGTPLLYGLILETKMDRSFLQRTLEEERSTVTRILTGPIK